MKKFSLAVWVAALALGCGSASLSDLPGRGILVAQGASARNPAELLVQLDSGRTDDFCWTLNSDVKATFNGRAMKIIERGGYSQLASDTCYPPQLAIDFDGSDVEAAETVIEVEDSTETMRARFASYFAPRTLALVEPQGGTVVRGQSAKVAWTPTTHRLEIDCDGTGCDPVLAFALAGANTTSWQISDAAALSTSENTLTVRVPANAPVGDGDLILASRYALRPQVLECDNAALCEAYWLDEALTVPLTVALP